MTAPRHCGRMAAPATRPWTALAAAALAAALGGCVSTRKHAQTESALAEAKAQLSKARGEAWDCVKQSAELQGSLDRSQARANALEAERDQLAMAKTSLTDALNAKQGELSGMLAQKQADLDEARKRLGLSQAAVAEHERQAEQLKAALDKATARAAQLEADRARLESANQELSGSMAARQDELSKTVASLNGDKRQLQARVAELERSQAEMNARAERELAQTRATYESLVGELKSEIDRGQIKITEYQGRLTVNVADTIFFDSGRIEVKPEGRQVLMRVADVFRSLPGKQLHIEGHTDNVPIHSNLRERFPTNWELSAARATNVARFLQDKAGIDPSLLRAVGCGEHRPVSPNDSPEGRAKNRRIELVLVNKDPAR